MKRIIFHIGTHKTATTAIQNTLSANRDMLQAKGVLYPATDRPPDPKHHKHNSLVKAVRGPEPEFETERHLLLSEFEASGCHTMVLSEEGLSGTPLERLNFLGQLARGFETQTICYLRRQDLFLESWWNQRVKLHDSEIASVETFCRRKNTQFRIRYDRFLLDGWASFSTVSPVNYDQAKSNGVVATFTETCDLPSLEEPGVNNVSPSANCALVHMLINQMGVPVNKAKIMRAFRWDTSRYVLGRRLRQEILDEVATCNQRLEAAYGIRFGTDLPEEPEEPLTLPPVEMVARALAQMSTR